MHLLKKRFIEKYLYWFTHKEPYVPYGTMLEMIVGSTSSSNNIHKVVYDNSNYRSMVMDVIEINHSYSCEGSHVDGEPNIDAIKFLEFLKDSDEPL